MAVTLMTSLWRFQKQKVTAEPADSSAAEWLFFVLSLSLSLCVRWGELPLAFSNKYFPLAKLRLCCVYLMCPDEKPNELLTRN